MRQADVHSGNGRQKLWQYKGSFCYGSWLLEVAEIMKCLLSRDYEMFTFYFYLRVDVSVESESAFLVNELGHIIMESIYFVSLRVKRSVKSEFVVLAKD